MIDIIAAFVRTTEKIKEYVDKKNNFNVIESTESNIELQPNKMYKLGEMSSLTITLASPTDSSIVNEYMISFDSGETATTLTYPSEIVWSTSPSIEANKHYEISIVDGYGLIIGF